MSNWKDIIPKEIKFSQLSLDECRNFKQFYDMLAQDVLGPPGFKICHQFFHHLLFYGLVCLEEKTFPALNKCWDELAPLFGGTEYDDEWLFYTWMFCDFPLDLKEKKTVIDHFVEFSFGNHALPEHYGKHLQQFHLIMKASRLGLYQERLSTSKVTKFNELFTNQVISTVRSVPYYESGEIFLTRIISYLGDAFQVHGAKCYPAILKETVIGMVERKLSILAETDDKTKDYEYFMKLSGPYWMSSTHPSQSIPIFSPDHYKAYY